MHRSDLTKYRGTVTSHSDDAVGNAFPYTDAQQFLSNHTTLGQFVTNLLDRDARGVRGFGADVTAASRDASGRK